jgi:hypothetical protein
MKKAGKGMAMMAMGMPKAAVLKGAAKVAKKAVAKVVAKKAMKKK